jgi:hypothetical protein
MVLCRGYGKGENAELFCISRKKYFYFFCPNLSLPQSRAHKQLLRVHMAFPTSAEVKAKFFCLLREHWPSIMILIFTWYGWLVDDDYMGHVVQAVGAAGVIVLLSTFKLQKNIWVYVSGMALCFIGTAEIIDTQHIVDIMGLGWLSSWSIIIITIAVQGSIASFVCVLFLYIFFFRSQISATMLVKIPICILFLLAAMSPTFMIFWVLMAFSGLFGPI